MAVLALASVFFSGFSAMQYGDRVFPVYPPVLRGRRLPSRPLPPPPPPPQRSLRAGRGMEWEYDEHGRAVVVTLPAPPPFWEEVQVMLASCACPSAHVAMQMGGAGDNRGT